MKTIILSLFFLLKFNILCAHNLGFGLSSSDSEGFAPQIMGFSTEANGQRPFASKLPEGVGEKPKTQVHTGSVVCIHGFFRSHKCMIPMGNTLRKAGFEAYLWDYQSRKETIEGHAENLVNVLNMIAAKRPGEPIHFTTHSLGGVIVRAAVNHPNCPQEAKIGRAVLLAPPNKGSHLARHFQRYPPIRWIFGNKTGRQLLTFEEEHMNQFGQLPPSIDALVISGTKEHRFLRKWIKGLNDGKVSVEETCLSTPHYHRILHVSHNWIMTSKESIAITTTFLLNDN